MPITGSTIEMKIAERQLAMKDLSSKSWFMSVCKTLIKYSLPSVHDLICDSPSRAVWKQQINTSVQEYWNEKLRQDAASKSSLKYLNINACQICTTHPSWDTVESNQRDVYRATSKQSFLMLYIGKFYITEYFSTDLIFLQTSDEQAAYRMIHID